MIQAPIATYGSKRNPSLTLSEKDKSIAASAPATQNTLWKLEAKMEAAIHHQIPVRSHCRGEAPDATAKEMDKGILIIATDNHAFQFALIL
jgi:hypothetical protein